ncbi:hypothetical protein C8F04DRAFT_1194159 [Mycena alexandri]|uniref:Uncharacterized protein n=1 Tax=Mycena alexandri TaxID=1745969 RepID=A0AAD6WTD8_9AGAR|nr:hypothetical protein C8F04DRAFT_1194159 [Mycena alexandri]
MHRGPGSIALGAQAKSRNTKFRRRSAWPALRLNGLLSEQPGWSESVDGLNAHNRAVWLYAKKDYLFAAVYVHRVRTLQAVGLTLEFMFATGTSTRNGITEHISKLPFGTGAVEKGSTVISSSIIFSQMCVLRYMVIVSSAWSLAPYFFGHYVLLPIMFATFSTHLYRFPLHPEESVAAWRIWTVLWDDKLM